MVGLEVIKNDLRPKIPKNCNPNYANLCK